jgi:hypothetical protein
MLPKLVLAFGVFVPTMIAGQNVAVGDTVWYVATFDVCRHSPATHLQPSIVGSVEGFVMDTFCIERGTLLDKPNVVTLEGPGEHSFHWYVSVST